MTLLFNIFRYTNNILKYKEKSRVFSYKNQAFKLCLKTT
nr:MAG TPA: hypothetical protein [Caudoviricetes sp.]DAU43034.1 MAG TPA: hypothetical protein [Bacteriophage sp.]